MLPLSCPVKYYKWYFSASILCVLQFHRFVIYKTIHLLLSLHQDEEYCYLFVSHMEGISLLKSILAALHFFKFYYIIFEMVETELSAIFKINEHPTLILLPNIYIFFIFHFFHNNFQHLFYLFCSCCAPSWHSELFIITPRTHFWWWKATRSLWFHLWI